VSPLVIICYPPSLIKKNGGGNMEMIHMNDIIDIIHRLRKEETINAIHRDTGHARKTIRKYRDLNLELH
jgi:hypothetical protein